MPTEYCVNKVTAHRCPALWRRFAHDDRLGASAGHLNNFVNRVLNGSRKDAKAAKRGMIRRLPFFAFFAPLREV